MPMELGQVLDIFAKVFAPISAFIGALVMVAMNRVLKTIDKTKDELTAYKLETEKRFGAGELNLKDFSLYVHKNFALEVDIQGSLSRVHDKIESTEERLAEKIDDGLAEVNRNILNTLQKK